MPTIRVMSWNIKQLGESKLTGIHSGFRPALVQDPNFKFAIDYISAVLHKYNLDLIVIMEII